jgi:hypothetical protein
VGVIRGKMPGLLFNNTTTPKERFTPYGCREP